MAASEDVKYPTVYGFWTNKGGVGKTTLSFHMATTYAELYPEKTVVVIDMCPQTNLSATLLTKTTETERRPGDEVVKDMQDNKKATSLIPKTIGGYFLARLDNTAVPVEKFRVRAADYNMQVPKNLMLVCGDSNLDLLAAPLSERARETSPATKMSRFKDVHMYLRDFIQGLADYHAKLQPGESNKLVVFIDTNPALSIYTQIALCAMTELVMPICADTFSLQAVNSMYHLMYGLYPTTSDAAKVFETKTFAYQVTEYGLSLPGIAAIIHNRNPILKENGQQRAATTRTHKAMAAEQCGRLFDGYQKAVQTGQLNRVFSVINGADGNPMMCNNVDEFADTYTATMRDMRSCGVAAVHSGFPLWQLLEKSKFVDSQFRVADFKESVPGLMKDLLYAMEVMLGHTWEEKNAEAFARLGEIANTGRAVNQS